MSFPERTVDASTREVQYKRLLDVVEHHGRTELGLMMNQAWQDDPKRLTFTFARYKFAARMLAGCKDVLEVGCGDVFPSRIVQQEVGRLTVTDFDPIFIQEATRRSVAGWELAGAFVHDMLSGPPQGHYDGMYARVAREEGCLLIPKLLKGILSDARLKSDEIHPNAWLSDDALAKNSPHLRHAVFRCCISCSRMLLSIVCMGLWKHVENR